MTAKDKAIYLIVKFNKVSICVNFTNEMLNNLEHIKNLTPSKTIFDLIEYWENVKKEIENL